MTPGGKQPPPPVAPKPGRGPPVSGGNAGGAELDSLLDQLETGPPQSHHSHMHRLAANSGYCHRRLPLARKIS